VEIKEKHQAKISNMLAASENLDHDMDMNRT
jgi:hypothetical protein